MNAITEILTRVRRILELVEIRPTEYNRAAVSECLSMIDAIIEAFRIAEQNTSEKKEEKE